MGKETSRKVRALTESDLSWLLPMDEASFPTAWSKAVWQEEIHGHLAHYYALLEDDVPFAYGGFWLVAGEAQIMRLAVSPTRRGEGLGIYLMTALMQKAKALGAAELTLEVREHNTPARRTYLHMGLTECGMRPHYYEDTGENAILMRCSL
jgi:ribosomal-protein-alanine N-acetyltransferase